MKFQSKNSSKNLNTKGNSIPIRKQQKKIPSKTLSKGNPLSANKIRNKTHLSPAPLNKGPQSNSKAQEQQYETNQRGYEDQEENFDAHVNIGNHKQKSKSAQNSQYDQLLDSSTKGFKRQKNLYFLENKKYQGKAKQESESENQIDEEQIEENQQDDFDQEDNDENMRSQDEEQQQNYDDVSQDEVNDASQQDSEQKNQIQRALSLLKQKRHSTSKLMKTQLQSINAEDQANIKTTMKNKSKTTQSQYMEALQLKTVLELYDKLVGLRYGQQNELQLIKQYPLIDESLDIPKYPPMSHQLYTASRQLQNEMVSNLSDYFSIFKTLAKKTVCSKNVKSNLQNDSQDQDNEMKNEEDNESTEVINLAEIVQADNSDNKEEDSLNPGRLNVDQLYSFIKQNISTEVSKVQTQLIKWSQKTSFLTPSSPTQLKSLLMQTPVGQAKKVMQNWQRMASKCQQKRGREMFKILFESEDNIHELSHRQIYDDYDLFIQLQKYYLERLEDDNEDGEFLQSATMKYLKNKQAKQLQHEKKQKEVDRKASKNRKIRYNVHTKLLNFMPSAPENVIETRDEIVRNIFNCNAKINEQGMEGNVGKYRAAQHHDDTELIDVE